MKKDIMKSNINLKRNIDQMDRYVTPYDNIFDNAVSITEFDLSLKSYFQKMKNGNLDHNLNDREINITKTNELCSHLQKRHKFNQI